MMRAGIDMGGTNTQCVLFDGRVLKSKCSIEGGTVSGAMKCYERLKLEADGKPLRVVLTGGGSRKVKKGHFPAPFRTMNEIEAVGKGGAWLSGKRDVFVVSIGTGTAFVSVKKGRAKHVGGTGVGGGTIYGLSELMIGKSVGEVEKLARAAKGHVDLTVRDIVGSGIGKIPADATAANFGKISGKPGEGEISASLLKMIGESIGVMAYFAAKTVGQEKRILVCGRVAMNGIVKKTVISTVRTFGGDARVPENAEYCAAIGAAAGSR